MNLINPAPIALFAYKRPDEFNRTVQALQQNYLASQSDLHIFVDGPKRAVDEPKVERVRQVARSVTGFKTVHLHFSEANQGCSNAIIEGVSQVLRDHPSTIVVEDDIVTTANFLDFVNQGLSQYATDPRVFSIGGYSLPFQRPTAHPDDVYFYGRTCAWGWGIWADRWFKTDWAITDFDAFMADPVRRKRFNHYGSDRVRMLRRSMTGEIDSWDIRLCYEQFKQKSLTAFPVVSKTENIGFNGIDGTNTNNYNRYETILDAGIQRQFVLPDDVSESNYYSRQLRHQFSVSVRLLNHLKTHLLMPR